MTTTTSRTTQITVRIPTDLVEYIDQRVEDGASRSRAVAVADALDRDRKRRRAEDEIQVHADLRAKGEEPYPDLSPFHTVDEVDRMWADLD